MSTSYNFNLNISGIEDVDLLNKTIPKLVRNVDKLDKEEKKMKKSATSVSERLAGMQLKVKKGDIDTTKKLGREYGSIVAQIKRMSDGSKKYNNLQLRAYNTHQRMRKEIQKQEEAQEKLTKETRNTGNEIKKNKGISVPERLAGMQLGVKKGHINNVNQLDRSYRAIVKQIDRTNDGSDKYNRLQLRAYNTHQRLKREIIKQKEAQENLTKETKNTGYVLENNKTKIGNISSVTARGQGGASRGAVKQGKAGLDKYSSYALLNMGYLVQDAPYGIRGIGNNISQTVQAFDMLDKQVKKNNATLGTNQTVFGAIKKMLSGPAGMIFMVGSVLPTALLVASEAWRMFKKNTEEAKDSAEDAKDEFKLLNAQLEIYSKLAPDPKEVKRSDLESENKDLLNEMALDVKLIKERKKSLESLKEKREELKKIREEEIHEQNKTAVSSYSPGSGTMPMYYQTKTSKDISFKTSQMEDYDKQIKNVEESIEDLNATYTANLKTLQDPDLQDQFKMILEPVVPFIKQEAERAKKAMEDSYSSFDLGRNMSSYISQTKKSIEEKYGDSDSEAKSKALENLRKEAEMRGGNIEKYRRAQMNLIEATYDEGAEKEVALDNLERELAEKRTSFLKDKRLQLAKYREELAKEEVDDSKNQSELAQNLLDYRDARIAVIEDSHKTATEKEIELAKLKKEISKTSQDFITKERLLDLKYIAEKEKDSISEAFTSGEFYSSIESYRQARLKVINESDKIDKEKAIERAKLHKSLNDQVSEYRIRQSTMVNQRSVDVLGNKISQAGTADRAIEMLERQKAYRIQIAKDNIDNEKEQELAILKIKEDASERAVRLKEEEYQRKLQFTKMGVQAGTDLVISGMEALGASDRSMFEVQKVSKASMAIINAEAAFASTMATGGIWATPLAWMARASGIAAAMRIMTQKYDSGASDSSGGGNTLYSYRGYDISEPRETRYNSTYSGKDGGTNSDKPTEIVFKDGATGAIVTKGTMSNNKNNKNDNGYFVSP